MGQAEQPLRSQRLRKVNFQGDALRLGMNWTEEDLAKPQVLVESAYGMGHPGTFHFRPLLEEVSNGVFEAGGKPGVFYASDICDGVAQAHAGMSYSLVSRDVQAALIEIHALGHPHDGMVVISGNDKSVPAHLVAIARCDRIHRRVPVLANAKTTGKYPVEYLWYAGGVPAVMLEIRDLLHLDCLTVTGKTLGENLADIERSSFFTESRGYLNNVKVSAREVLRPRSDPFGPDG